MTDASEFVAGRIVDTSDAALERDRALYDVISKHGIRPIVWRITPEETASLADYFAKLFGFAELLRFPVLSADAEAEQREREAERHAPLLRAIRQGSR